MIANVLTPKIQLVSDALLISAGPKERTASGVFNPDGTIVESAIHSRNTPFNLPVFRIIKDTKFIDSCIFGGFLFAPHFGHTIVESTARLWAARYLVDSSYPIVFLPGLDSTVKIPQFFKDLVYLLGLESPLYLVSNSLRCRKLFVPSQLFGLGKYLDSHPEFITFFHQLRSKKRSGGSKFDKVYVSRANYPLHHGSLICEKHLEDNLRQQEYEIVHPERLSIEEQIAIYTNSDTLLFSEGSALHLFAMVAHKHQKVGIICRRWSAQQFVNQINSFCGLNAKTFQNVTDYILPQDHHHPIANSAAVINFENLKADLVKAGFVNKDSPWYSPTKKHFDEEIKIYASAFENNIRWSKSLA